MTRPDDAGDRAMPRPLAAFGLLAAVGVAGCTTVPQQAWGPSVIALPGPNKTLEQFQQEDISCRNYAWSRAGGVTPGQAATQSAVGSAALGTAIGAAAGAAIGAASGNAGAGAAIGAGTGLVAGSIAGAGAAQQSAAATQQAFDTLYAQCMSASGNRIEATPPPQAAGPWVTAPPVYVSPGWGYWPGWWGPGWWGSSVTVGVAPAWGWGGWGWGGGWRGWGGWRAPPPGGWGGWHGAPPPGGWGGGWRGGPAPGGSWHGGGR
jgi:hypothetical protein